MEFDETEAYEIELASSKTTDYLHRRMVTLAPGFSDDQRTIALHDTIILYPLRLNIHELECVPGLGKELLRYCIETSNQLSYHVSTMLVSHLTEIFSIVSHRLTDTCASCN